MLCVHAKEASKHSGNGISVPCPMFSSLRGSFDMPGSSASRSGWTLPLPALFNSSLTLTGKCNPEATASHFITLTLNQEYPEQVKDSSFKRMYREMMSAMA